MKHNYVTVKIFVITLFLTIGNTGIVFSQEPTVSPTPKPVEYTLPYPGLLPDHPLYILRVVRDTVQEIMVSNPLKKAEYYQLQADKGISASVVLSQKKGTAELAAATAKEALDDFEKAIEAATAAKKQGININEVRTKLIVSNSKHTEVLSQIQGNVKESEQHSFVKEEERALNLGKKAKALQPVK